MKTIYKAVTIDKALPKGVYKSWTAWRFQVVNEYISYRMNKPTSPPMNWGPLAGFSDLKSCVTFILGNTMAYSSESCMLSAILRCTAEEVEGKELWYIYNNEICKAGRYNFSNIFEPLILPSNTVLCNKVTPEEVVWCGVAHKEPHKNLHNFYLQLLEDKQ